jgi:hypothetical protein
MFKRGRLTDLVALIQVLFSAVCVCDRWDSPAGKGPGLRRVWLQSVEKSVVVASEEFGCFSEKSTVCWLKESQR